METEADVLTSRPVAAGDSWIVREIICRAGPEQRAFEERHETVSISAVLGGTFRYRTEAGTALLHPGALLLGQAGACFECGHDHSRRSEEHTSELQSLMRISYAVFCLKQKTDN